jgi:hypothetical protein
MIDRSVSRDHDPLLNFTEQLDSGGLDGHSETANLASLFACAGATLDQHPATATGCRSPDLDRLWRTIHQPSGHWIPRLVAEPMRSRIVLLQATDVVVKRLSAPAIRRLWQGYGAIVSAYSGGWTRISASRNVF